MGEEYSDVPVRDRHHSAGRVHDGRSAGDGERVLLRLHTVGLRCRL